MIEQIRKLVDIKLDNLNTVDIGVITQVDLTKLRCNVKLKHKIQGNEIELFDVPVAIPKFHDSAIIIAPKEGDIVLVVFSKYELEEQLKNADVVDVNELLKFNLNNAIIITGIYTAVDDIPTINKEEILIWHKTGTFVKIGEQEIDEFIIHHKQNHEIKITKDDEIIIQHKTGAYIKFKQDGSLEIKATRVDFLKL